MAKLKPAERRKRRKQIENIKSAQQNWETHFKPHILHLLREARAGHYAAFILTCCSAEQAYSATKDYSIDSEEPLMRQALKHAMRHWAENGGLILEEQWSLAEEEIDEDFMLLLNKTKHHWRLPEGFQLIHGLTEPWSWNRKVDTDVVGVTGDGWALREVVPNSDRIIYNASNLCDMLAKGIDNIYIQALYRLDPTHTTGTDAQQDC